MKRYLNVYYYGYETAEEAQESAKSDVLVIAAPVDIPMEVTRYVTLYRQSDGLFGVGFAYDTKEEAEKVGKNNNWEENFLGTYPITIKL